MEVEFTAQDIVRTIDAVVQIDDLETRRHKCVGLKHKLFSGLKGIIDNITFCNSYQSQIQEYLTAAEESLARLNQSLNSVATPLNKWDEEIIECSLDHAQEVLDCLNAAIPHFPIPIDRIEQSEQHRSFSYFLEPANFHMLSLVYLYNKIFAGTDSSETYRLAEDAARYFINCPSNTRILINDPDILPIETKVDYMQGAVIPLVENAVTHAWSAGKDYEFMSIWIKSEENEQEEYVVSVKDAGSGIPEDVQERIFKERVSTKTDTSTQHGIGLMDVKQFVEEQCGRVWFETKLGKGTTFYFTIPYKTKQWNIYRQ